MNLDIVLPTKGRKQKLENCLASVFHSAKKVPVNIYIYFSIKEEYEEYYTLFKNFPEIHIEWLDEYRVPDFWNGHLQRTGASAMCYINDDILFYPDTLEVIVDEYLENFPDFDGVMGLRQANLPSDQAVEGAFGVIGRKYAERFPKNQVFCPDYDRFYADFELWRYAKSIGKFHFCTTARIEHLHPSTDKKYIDDTHKDVRKWIAGDKKTFNLRQHRDLLWGKSLELVNKELEYEDCNIST